MIDEVLVDNENLEQNQETTDVVEGESFIDELIKDVLDENETLNSKNNEEFENEPASTKERFKFDDVLFDRKVKVFVKTNKDGYITQIDSDVFLKEFDGWIQFDEGYGDKYVYAQTSYF